MTRVYIQSTYIYQSTRLLFNQGFDFIQHRIFTYFPITRRMHKEKEFFVKVNIGNKLIS